jgi:hypothetical protein
MAWLLSFAAAWGRSGSLARSVRDRPWSEIESISAEKSHRRFYDHLAAGFSLTLILLSAGLADMGAARGNAAHIGNRLRRELRGQTLEFVTPLGG